MEYTALFASVNVSKQTTTETNKQAKIIPNLLKQSGKREKRHLTNMTYLDECMKRDLSSLRTQMAVLSFSLDYTTLDKLSLMVITRNIYMTEKYINYLIICVVLLIEICIQ